MSYNQQQDQRALFPLADQRASNVGALSFRSSRTVAPIGDAEEIRGSIRLDVLNASVDVGNGTIEYYHS